MIRIIMIVGVENNHTNIPRVNPGRFRVAIKGTPTFPVRRIVQGVPSMGISWLVFKGVLDDSFKLGEKV